LIVVALAVFSVPVFAQTAERERTDFRHATTLAVFGGGAADTADAGPVVGGTLGWQLTRSVALEGVGRWYDRGGGSDAFAAALLVQADLFTSGDTHLFVNGGLGLYHVSFAPAGRGRMPAFYGRRMTMRPDAVVTESTFTDPSIVLGGGLKFGMTRNLSVRPAVDATIVPVGSRYHYVTTFAISLAYRFEQHPVTASRSWK
jgi:hypothetical protein